MSAVKYCLGFIFSEDLSKILLVKKERGPEQNIGKLNGIGGKIENDEMPLNAIIRETKEETGLELLKWNHFCTLSGEGYVMWCFSCATNKVFNFKQKEDEFLSIFHTDIHKCYYNTSANLDFLIPMAISKLNGSDKVRCHIIQESYDYP